MQYVTFQEVIQNAEDAGATKVTFLIDHTTYGKNAELLYDPCLADHQVATEVTWHWPSRVVLAPIGRITCLLGKL